MTRSTGAWERQRRREELFSAELKLRRVMLHIMSAIAWACRERDEAERSAQLAAYSLVSRAYMNVVAEQKELLR